MASINASTSGAGGVITTADATGTLQLQSASTTVATINAFGIGLGTGVPSSGIGITFPATQSASSDANTLDDYEEGTWTPNIGGTATYSTQFGSYVKIGSLVYAYFILTVGTIGTGSTQVLSGFPFSVRNSTAYDAGAISYFDQLLNGFTWLTIQMQNNSATCNFAGGTTAATTIVNTASVWKSGTQIVGTVVYRTT
jgi:hypothetical protein